VLDHWLGQAWVRTVTELADLAVGAAERAIGRGGAAQALPLLERMMALEPADERLFRLALRADAALGNRVGMLRRYQVFGDWLEAEIGARPSAETRRLVRELEAQGEPAPPALDAPGASPAESPRAPRMAWWPAGLAALALGVGGLALWQSRPPPAPPVIDRKSPAYPLYVTARGLIDERSREGYAEAEKLLRNAIAVDPGFAPAYARLGLALWMPVWWKAQGDPAAKERIRTEAIGHVRKALAIEPNLPDGLAVMGLLLTEPGQGAPWLERAVAAEPEVAEYWLWLGNAQDAARNARGARDAYARAVALRPGWDRAVKSYVRALRTTGEPDAAAAQIRRFATLSRDSYEIGEMQAMQLMAQFRYAEAARLEADLLAAKPKGSWNGRRDLLYLATWMGDTALARRLVANEPRFERLVDNYADPVFAAREAEARGDDWWTGDFLGPQAAHLVAQGRSDLLVRRYDARYGDVSRFMAAFPKDAALAGAPLVLALRSQGRAAEAARLAAALDALLVRRAQGGERDVDLTVAQARVAAVAGRPEAALDALRRALDQGWIGELSYPVAGPAADPVFADFSDDPRFRVLCARFLGAAEAERARYRADPPRLPATALTLTAN
jgi:tetratricopeptide (TPR) repeat protein